MKKLTKILSMALVLMLSLTVMIGCGGPKLTPDQSAKIVLDILLKGDNSQIAEIGMTQEEFEECRQKMEQSMEEAMTQTGGSMISDESKKLLLDGILEGLTKMEYTTKLVSEEKDTATVEISIKSFDMAEIQNKLTEEVQTYYTSNPSATQSELFDFTFQKEAELMKAGTFKSEPTTITVSLSSDGKVWAPDEAAMTKIGNSLLA